jgi:hypothetical protein
MIAYTQTKSKAKMLKESVKSRASGHDIACDLSKNRF